MQPQAPRANLVSAEFSPLEERWNAATHALGTLLAVAGLILLLGRAGVAGASDNFALCALYGAALVLLYSFSALHHAISHPGAKHVFLALDHCGIYLLIAGTYTPFCLIMPPGQGWLLLAFIWGLAGVGISVQMTCFVTGYSNHYERFGFIAYLALGWIPLLWVWDDVVTGIPTSGLALLAAGGLAYTTGVAFYLWRTLVHHHAIWHLFVVAGSALQFLTIYLYVAPVTN
ncbi:hemolysin III family protein [Hoeflea sp. WL0058]|uniref:Hemolysin III family protein n=1 Tax=Flavimaribacter sediminis TaxID=2865987 RepID=A0AAE2ZPD4_9HYPH|nr:hemolysin III family protein [Flavimaribacter sediminis]MBW8638292.1 hemolysin III family protein [Flavimaribacter sediminis]